MRYENERKLTVVVNVARAAPALVCSVFDCARLLLFLATVCCRLLLPTTTVAGKHSDAILLPHNVRRDHKQKEHITVDKG